MSGFFSAPRIAWGPGAIEQLGSLGARRVLVVADPAVARGTGHRRVLEELAKSPTSVETIDARVDPDRTDAVIELGARVRDTGVDGLIGLGGGRTLDAVKAARALATRPELLGASGAPPLLDLPEGLAPRLVAIPTTSGSGSDASWTCDLWTGEGAPIELAHRALVPDWSLVDPQFPASLPAEQRLDGALETVALAAEAYLSAWANPFSDALALDSLATVLERLPHALRWSDDPEASAALHYAATAAGLAASNSQRGLAHALARALQPTTGLAYGRLLGILLPVVLDFDHPGARERLERIAAAMPPGPENARLPLVQRVRRLEELFRFPTNLTAAGVPADRVEADRAAIVTRTLRSPAALANPRVPSDDEVRSLLATALGR
jgi:alcohol dehydrogenase class IV